MGLSGSLEKMKIQAFEKSDFTSKVGGPFQVFINPESYSHSYKIRYSDTRAQGSSGASCDFNRIGTETVKFDLWFDGTGVVASKLAGSKPSTGDGITKQIQAFRKLIFRYNGNVHSPNYLQLSWGKLVFKCRLTSLDINYTLFKPDGTPLRAKATVSFVGYKDEKARALEAGKSSPDVSHDVTVKAGETLPLLCYRIYGSSAFYPQVARANGLAGFRELPAGTRLHFPPIGERRK